MLNLTKGPWMSNDVQAYNTSRAYRFDVRRISKPYEWTGLFDNPVPAVLTSLELMPALMIPSETNDLSLIRTMLTLLSSDLFIARTEWIHFNHL